MSKIGLILGGFLLVGAVVTGCSSASTPTASPNSTATATNSAAPAASGATITISGMSFGDPITVSPGASISIVNSDTVEHSVTSEPKGKFDTHVDGSQQKTFTAPTEPGEYPFICVYHPSMKGTLIVK